MKHLLLSSLLVLASYSTARAQSANPAIWCPPGATWVYGYGGLFESGTVTVRYTSDIVVGGQPAQVLTRVVNSGYYLAPGVYMPGPPYSLPSVITRAVGDRVEVQANGQFYTLYDFAALPGSSWLTAPVTPQGACPSGLVWVNVDSVGRQQVGGRSLRWFRAHLTAAAGTTIAGNWPGRIYEQLGNVAQYMQPQSPICGGTDPGFMGALTTFQASGWPTIGYNGTLLASTQALAEAAGFAVYPNPSAGARLLTLKLPVATTPNAQLVLLDNVGRHVRQQQAASGQGLDVHGLPAGLYTVLLREPGKQPLVRRVVLQ